MRFEIDKIRESSGGKRQKASEIQSENAGFFVFLL